MANRYDHDLNVDTARGSASERIGNSRADDSKTWIVGTDEACGAPFGEIDRRT